MATLRRYEIDAIVSEVHEELEKKLPKFDDSKIKNSKEFKELLKLEKEEKKLSKRITQIEKESKAIVKFQLAKSKDYYYTYNTTTVLNILKNDHYRTYNIDKSLIERTVILNSGKDLEDIVKIVVKKLSK